MREAKQRHRRARRYKVDFPLRFRFSDSKTWRRGKTINMSRSGLLFSTSAAAEKGDSIELVIHLHAEVFGEPAAEVCCEGCIVRTVTPTPRERVYKHAARILSYRFKKFEATRDGEVSSQTFFNRNSGRTVPEQEVRRFFSAL